MDPLIPVAFAVHARKGAYALLIGSGVSRAAEIPTADQVITDLARRAAQAHGIADPPDPVAWYREAAGEEASYSHILAKLAPSPADRSHLLRGYFEPSPEERDRGAKAPTAAHKSIASLVQEGYVRVILTTNFDRLLEKALTEIGLEPSVVSSPDHIEGMTPIQHADCTIIKVHGDYLDLGTRNTIDELSDYPPRLSELLDRVITEYGLIVCGWSGDWDPALRRAILRSTRHRFSTFWTCRGGLSEAAQELVSFRQASIVRIESADAFFRELEEKIRSVRESGRSHPLSPDLAVATLKRYLPDPRGMIRTHDLLMSEVQRVQAALASEEFALGPPPPDDVSARERAERAWGVAETLAALLLTGCRWGSEDHRSLWVEAVSRSASLEDRPLGQIFTAWKAVRIMPAAAALYAAGVACVFRGDFECLRALLYSDRREGEEEGALILAVNAGEVGIQALYSPPNRKTPGSDWLFEKLRPRALALFGGAFAYKMAFNRFELLLAMVYKDRDLAHGSWAPMGRFIWQQSRTFTPAVFKKELQEMGDRWPPLSGGLFSRDPARAVSVLDALMSIQHWQMSMH